MVLGWRSGHQMTGTVADGQLPFLAALHRTGTVAVQPVDVHRVFVGKATAALVDADRSRLRIVLDVFD